MEKGAPPPKPCSRISSQPEIRRQWSKPGLNLLYRLVLFAKCLTMFSFSSPRLKMENFMEKDQIQISGVSQQIGISDISRTVRERSRKGSICYSLWRAHSHPLSLVTAWQLGSQGVCRGFRHLLTSWNQGYYLNAHVSSPNLNSKTLCILNTK